MEDNTITQPFENSVKLSIPRDSYYNILLYLSNIYKRDSSDPKALIKLYEVVVCIGVDSSAVEFAGMIQKHLETNYNAFWEMYLASKPDGTKTI